MFYLITAYLPFDLKVLGKMNSIKERHVNLIVDNKYLYDDAPLPVLRHIWVAHPHKYVVNFYCYKHTSYLVIN